MQLTSYKMSERYSLRWNDFQISVSQSFGRLQKESLFNDVILVSEDDVQISAHKIVLSASSRFLKKILQNNPHKNTLLFLGGVTSQYLSLVLDYIYQGEVQIFQDQLDGFLSTAQKLQIEGLLEKPDKVNLEIKGEDEEVKGNNTSKPDKRDNQVESHNDINNGDKTKVNYELSLGDLDKDQLLQKKKELYQRTNESNGRAFECLGCGKFMNNQANMMRHVETHIEGLSYKCQVCGKMFRSSSSLSCHNTTFHNKNMLL